MTYQKEKVKDEKIKRVNELKDLLSSYEGILILDMEGVPTTLMQKLREEVWDLGELRVIKNSLVKIAIDELGDENLKQLKQYLTHMRGLFFTNDALFKAARKIAHEKRKLPPREGKIPYKDIIIEEGGTGLKTGPEMRDLRVANIPIRIIDGEIFVKEQTELVSEDEPISPREAKAMEILDIKPLEAKMNVVIGVKNGKIVPKHALTLSVDEWRSKFENAIKNAINFGFKAEIPTKYNITNQIRKTVQISKNLGVKTGLVTPNTVNDLVSRCYSIARKFQDEIPELSKEEKEG